MSGVTLPPGYIITHNYIWGKGHGGNYCGTSHDDNIKLQGNIFVDPKGLESLFRELYARGRSHPREGNRVYIPSVIIRKNQGGSLHHSADVLVPPTIKSYPKLLVPGSVVPLMKIVSILQNGNEVTGYRLTSEYTGNQVYYAPPLATTSELAFDESMRFQGKVISNDKGRPVVRIQNSLRIDSFMARTNIVKLEQMLQSDERFWWTVPELVSMVGQNP